MKNKRKDKERARLFRLFGGRWHDKYIRMYAPFDAIKLGTETYELVAPLKEGGEWVYAYNPTPEEE